MILYHNQEVELSRNLFASKPEGVLVVDCSTGAPDIPISAYPTVVVNLPAYNGPGQMFDAEGQFVGFGDVLIPKSTISLRCPTSWEAVQSLIDYAEAHKVESNE